MNKLDISVTSESKTRTNIETPKSRTNFETPKSKTNIETSKTSTPFEGFNDNSIERSMRVCKEIGNDEEISKKDNFNFTAPKHLAKKDMNKSDTPKLETPRLLKGKK